MVEFENKSHNDVVSPVVKVEHIFKAGGESREYKIQVCTIESESVELIIWDGSPAADIEWQQGEWYQLQDALLKKWSSKIEFNAANKTTAEQIENPNSMSEGTNQRDEITTQLNQTENTTSLVHTTNSYLDRKNMGRRARQDDYMSVFEETIDYAERIEADAIVHTGNLFWSKSPAQRIIDRCREILERAAKADIDFYLLYGQRDLKVQSLLSEFEEAQLINRLTPRWNKIGDIAVFAHDVTVDNPESGFHYPPNDSVSRLAAVHDDIAAATGFIDIKSFESEIGWSLDAILYGNQNERMEMVNDGVKILSPGPPERVIGKQDIDRESQSPRVVHRYDISSSGIDVQTYETSSRPVAGFRVNLGSKDTLDDIQEALPIEELKGAASIFEITGQKDENSPSKDEIQRLIGKYAAVARAYDERKRMAKPLSISDSSHNKDRHIITGLDSKQSDEEELDTQSDSSEHHICPDCKKKFKFERVYNKHRYSCDGRRSVKDGNGSSGTSKGSEGSTTPDINPCPLSEYYEAFRSLRDALKKLDIESEDDAGLSPQAQYYRVIESIVSQGHPEDEDIPGYGPQHADRASHKTSDYRKKFGNEEWITAYPAIESEGPEPAYIDRVETDLSELELHISRPVPPGEETAIPIVVESEAELSEALWLLSQLPAKPSLSPNTERDSDSLPIEAIYEAEIKDTNTDPVDIFPPSSNDDNGGAVEEDGAIITEAEAKDLLRQCVGDDGEFRDHQWEAINALANEKNQLLLVQRTGWGKSTVYFIATHALRKHGAGPTLIISPLLSLMRDQVKNAEEELGLSAATINSNNEDEWGEIYNGVVDGQYDIVLISPERLNNDEFREEILNEMADGFGMLVVDEAHCISDWGHDFRPDYQRVTRILDRLPKNVPVAATTATANDRVVDDITTQLPGLEVIRGDLVRESLRIQAINIGSRQNRLAWLAENLPEGQRAGIVYCLTISDVQRVTEWLQKHGHNVKAYHGSLDDDSRRQREQLLLDNEVDALVATNALGMGFDKPDLKFVIHFQRPPNLIRYYQEIGRAGRNLDQAHAVVLSGSDDDETAEYFIESAFPAAENFETVLSTIKKSEEPLTGWDIRRKSNASHVNTCLDILQVESIINRTDDGFVRSANEWDYPAEKYESITDQRYEELSRIQEFMETGRCLTLFIDDELDGKMDEPCGRCANCTEDFYPRTVQNKELIQKAIEHYQESGIGSIDNRVYRYDDDGGRSKIPEEHQLEVGRSLSVYEEPGWGTAVQEGKYESGRFSDSLVTGAAKVIEDDWQPSPEPEWITFIPSSSEPRLLANFAARLADELDMEVVDCIKKTRETKPQKELSSSTEKCANVRSAFTVTDDVKPKPVLLVDDIVASRWTLTEVGINLSKAGCDRVYPFALSRRRG